MSSGRSAAPPDDPSDTVSGLPADASAIDTWAYYGMQKFVLKTSSVADFMLLAALLLQYVSVAISCIVYEHQYGTHNVKMGEIERNLQFTREVFYVLILAAALIRTDDRHSVVAFTTCYALTNAVAVCAGIAHRYPTMPQVDDILDFAKYTPFDGTFGYVAVFAGRLCLRIASRYSSIAANLKANFPLLATAAAIWTLNKLIDMNQNIIEIEVLLTRIFVLLPLASLNS